MKNDFLKELKVGDLVTIYEEFGYRHFNKVINISKRYVDTDFFGYRFSLETGKCINNNMYKLVRQTELDKKKSIEKYHIEDIKNIIFNNISNNKKVIEITKLVDSWKDGDIR